MTVRIKKLITRKRHEQSNRKKNMLKGSGKNQYICEIKFKTGNGKIRQNYNRNDKVRNNS